MENNFSLNISNSYIIPQTSEGAGWFHPSVSLPALRLPSVIDFSIPQTSNLDFAPTNIKTLIRAWERATHQRPFTTSCSKLSVTYNKTWHYPYTLHSFLSCLNHSFGTIRRRFYPQRRYVYCGSFLCTRGSLRILRYITDDE